MYFYVVFSLVAFDAVVGVAIRYLVRCAVVFLFSHKLSMRVSFSSYLTLALPIYVRTLTPR